MLRHADILVKMMNVMLQHTIAISLCAFRTCRVREASSGASAARTAGPNHAGGSSLDP
jgi:hypothetical protein